MLYQVPEFFGIFYESIKVLGTWYTTCWVPSSQMTDRLSVAVRAGHYSARAIEQRMLQVLYQSNTNTNSYLKLV